MNIRHNQNVSLVQNLCIDGFIKAHSYSQQGNAVAGISCFQVTVPQVTMLKKCPNLTMTFKHDIKSQL